MHVFPSRNPLTAGFTLFVCLATFSAVANARTLYEVGPGKPYASLQAVAPLLAPGDTVTVAGNTTYGGGVVFTKNGTAASPIRIVGVRVQDKRPVLSGGSNTVEFRANHYIFESFEVTGGTSRGLYHHGDQITVRDCLVRDCPNQGILGADSDSGSLLLEFTEIRNCGAGTQAHQVYMATDNTKYPAAVFRMQFCYVHHGNGGNNIKSRAGRSEIYYNWIEGAFYHELELIGADGQPPALVREDSDVVGNVLVQYATQGTFFARIGGDGTGTSNGRHRFAFNTFIQPSNKTGAVFRLFDTLQSFEAHNNVIYKFGAASKITDTANLAIPYSSIAVSGYNNWIPAGSFNIPAQWSGTLNGTASPFVNASAGDFAPAGAGPLINTALLNAPGPAGFPFPSPLVDPLFTVPGPSPVLPGFQKARSITGTRDIGSIEVAAPFLPGSGEDLTMSTFVNMAGAGAEPWKVIFTNDELTVAMNSPGGTFTGALPLLAGQLFTTGNPPTANPLFPFLHMEPALIESLYDPFSAPPPDTGVLPAGGLVINFTVPAGLAGATIRIQALVVSVNAMNGIFAISSPHDLRLE